MDDTTQRTIDDAASKFMELNRAREEHARGEAERVNPALAQAEEDAEPGSPEPSEHGAEALQEEPGAQSAPEDEPQQDEDDAQAAEAEADAEGDDDPLLEVQVQGQRMEVPLSELVKGYQRQSDYTKKTEELAQQRREIEAQAQTVLPQQQQALAQTQNLAAQLQQALTQYAPSPQQLAELEQTDPGAYSAYMLKRQQQQQLVAATQQQQMEQHRTAVQARIPQERAALMSADSDFTNDFNGTYAKVGAWVTSSGKLSPEEWQDVIDHRLVLIAKKAMDSDQGHQATRKERARVVKKVAKLPKVRPSTPRDARDTNAEEYDRAIGRLQQGHQSNDDVAAAFLARERKGTQR